MGHIAIRAACLAIAITTLAPAGTAFARDTGRGDHGHPGSAYGLAGGLSPDLALANVYSGIYGVPYTYDRRDYDFNDCPPVLTAGSQRYTITGCAVRSRPLR